MIVLALGILLASAAALLAAPTAVTINGNTATAQGNQSAGVHSGADFDPNVINILNVNSLFNPIAPASGVTGISFNNGTGGNVIVNSGIPGNNVVINTLNAIGIFATSVGTPSSSPPVDPFLKIPIPGAAAVNGGAVTVNSYSDITTTGNDAAGIVGRSATTGYPISVLFDLVFFTGAGISFTVDSVGGVSTNVGHAVTGTLVDANGNSLGTSTGTFTVNANGSFSFTTGNDFTNMAVGETRQMIVSYGVAGTNSTAAAANQTTGSLVVQITRTASGYTTNAGAYSNTYGPIGSTSSVLPDLLSYKTNLLALAAAGGAGNSVSITNYGSIHTSGNNSHGIIAESLGGGGPGGRDGSISHSADAGGDGSRGGMASVQANGSITTTGTGAIGVLARSAGGNGGNGGDGGTFRYGARGGTGGNGGLAIVTGDGSIHTTGDQSSGIMAISQGGDGGGGGSGGSVTGGGNGGFGGQGGDVFVQGSWNILTEGNQAHGIWAKSTGGNAGSGGSGGWIAGAPGGGGQATDGGHVTVVNDGTITTLGNDSYGIYAESIGGFGGQGGNGGSIFYSTGGDGNSAGSGGQVEVYNLTNGTIMTTGERSFAIYAQSVGGGGGSGGGAGAIVGVGGGGASGGRGGSVLVANDADLYAMGQDSRGIYAQSIGGGGGDGGNASGIGAIGGHGSGTSDSSTVVVSNRGNIHSAAQSIFAQSIGGGGGSGGSSSGWFSVGGSGGGGGNAGQVTVYNSGFLQSTQDNSSALFAQSVGGGGGNGGGSVSAGAFGSVAIGGSGGTGGNGDRVTVITGPSSIYTSGGQSHGIFAQSVGGGGGNGGYAVAASVGVGVSASVAIGGNGAGGGNGSNVTVFSQSTIATLGSNSHGIFAQSVGGGGGAGGFSIAASAAGSGFSGSFSLGGQGGAGGNAGRVDLTSLGDITTYSNHSYGLLAQSIGGGGGDGGFSVAGTFNAEGIGAAIGIGGAGGSGGYSGGVTLTNGGNVITYGRDSHAIFAQSVGGGGGSGGFSVAGSISPSIAGASLALGIGGSGGSGGNAGSVTAVSLNSSNLIATVGEHSYGMVAQSIGGGGGDGGFAIAGSISGGVNANLGFGGSGGTAGNGASVLLDNYSSIETFGSNSHALFAQSVGGGGGSGGFSIAGSISASSSINASFGGSGGGGGNAGDVTLLSHGDSIITIGDRSYGALAQSLGGGGGDGGFSIAGGLSANVGINLGVGGSGGTASSAGNVYLENHSSIYTFGNDSHALFAQSVGGGGGSGGFSVAGGIASGGNVSIGLGGSGGAGGNAGNVTLISTGTNITTMGDRSYGILAQSVGGGGGDGGFSVAGGLSGNGSLNLALGGSGSGAGAAGTVTVSNSSQIVTMGSNSHAIFAQSVGGSGGSGGFSVAGGIAPNGGTLNAGIGGSGGNGGSGNHVSVTSTADMLVTMGDHSDGILAQSLGGGGGDGGFSIAGGISRGASISFAMGGSGGNGSSAGDVDVLNSSSIFTYGTNSHGIFAQSVGGSGGSGGFSVAGGIAALGGTLDASIGGSGGDGASAGHVTVTSTATNISTFGDRSYGILAQSIGGSGGDGGFSIAGGISRSASVNFSMGGSGGDGGTGGDVDLINSSRIFTMGTNSHGLFAQSVGGGGGSGGWSVAGGISANVGAVDVSIGGSGGNGATAGRVSVTSTATNITTLGDHSYGILAQSIGGNGGDGGFSVAGGMARSGSVSFSMGGSGGDGGAGGEVTLSSTGDIFTFGTNSHALFAQSVGGNGGSGGWSVAGGITTSSNSLDVSVSLGGSGGNGATASNVVVSSTGSTVATIGDHSSGILAQSLGGGGGDGGFSVAGGISTSKAVNFSLGGAGGDGARAGEVDVTNSSLISTMGTNSHGIFAQSVGGGGGDGGFSVAGGITSSSNSFDVSVSLGGSGGAGSVGGKVSVTSVGPSISTVGGHSSAILAQSIGGGGGDGGFSVAGGISGGRAVNFSLGGSGGAGSQGGEVDVTNSAAISTHGENSHGIFAQSVGGGGGDGGFSVAGGIAASNSIQVSIGGSGGSGSSGGTVNVENTGAFITTLGERSSGILAQSIGGGGGDGGFSVAGGLSRGTSIDVSIGGSGSGGGTGGNVSVFNTAQIFTGGELSYGILAQSVGGGGGDGGFSVGGTLTKQGTGLTFSMGGSGGDGGAAGTVGVDNDGMIMTTNTGSHGILAQSIGGSGGAGGFSGSLSGGFGDGSHLSASVGGWGGNASDGNTVGVTNSGTIVTTGQAAYGIFAQSVGGGGGDGGFSLSAAMGLSQTNKVNLSVSIGGFGGGGGNGGEVTVSNTAVVVTEGLQAHGIVAQSVGGGGGDGGFSASGAIGKGTNTHEFAVSVGGFGGAGGNGGSVQVFNSGNITTLGQGSDTINLPDDAVTATDPRRGTNITGSIGIMAQSVGGGGGNGGMSFAGTLGLNGSESKNISVSVGGSGGPAGQGGSVMVNNSGAIDTSAVDSYGILAQSIGGGGGTGGSSAAVGLGFGGRTNTWNVNIAIAVGGHGGDGDTGGDVTVNNYNRIITRNSDSHGIYAQSIGGGGGDGGSSFTATIGFGAASGGRTFNGNIAVGGEGGDGNTGGEVSVFNLAGITTLGDKSDGIHAQSIGGGGGDGGSSHGLSLLLKAGSATLPSGQNGGANWKLQFNIGGDGGTGNDGGAVSVNNSGGIFTSGAMSRGIFAQSVGGGGGSGGDGMNAIGYTGEDYVKLGLLVSRSEATSGGSGNILWRTLLSQLRDVAVAVGGDEGASGNGGHVGVTNSGDIFTTGYASTAIFAQSIGGGGGEAQSFGTGTDSGGTATAGLTGKFALGGAGGAAGNGAEVDVVNHANLETTGDGAYGIFAQSVGGGGGVAGNSDLGLRSYGNFGLGLAYGQSGGGGGDGGNVIVNNTGDILTKGASSYGMFVQSVGGGGGVGSSVGTGLGNVLLQNSFAGSVGGAGSAGNISITQNGNIFTLGDNADGIFAQSAGGSNYGGNVTVSLTGNVFAEGTNANGIYVQSRGNAGAGNLNVTLYQGTIQGGFGSSAAVRFADGVNNSLNNFGVISNLNGYSGYIAIGGNANESVINNGTMTGSIDLGSGTNSLLNAGGATFNAGNIIRLGAGNSFVNVGTLLPGAGDTIEDTSITGNFRQSSAGAYDVKLSSATAYDQLLINGSAELDGKLSIARFNDFLPKKADQFVVVYATDGVTGQFSSLDDPLKGNYALKLGISYSSTAAVVQVLQDSFVPFAMSCDNRIAVAENLDKVSGLNTMGGDAREATLITLLNTIPGTNLYAYFDLIGPEEFGAMFDMSAGAAAIFTHNVDRRAEELRFGTAGYGNLSITDPRGHMDTPWAKKGNGADDSTAKPDPNGWHVFANGSGKILDVSDSDCAAGYDIETTGVTLGADRLVCDGLGIGLTASYVGNRAFLTNNGKITVNGGRGGAYGTWFGGNAYLNGSIGFGYDYYDTRRAAVSGNAYGSTGGPEVDGYLAAGYDVKCNRLTFGPVLSVQYIYVGVHSFDESGSLSPLHLEYNDANSLETFAGARIAYDIPCKDVMLRPQIKLGWQHECFDTEHAITSRFASGAGDDFTVHSASIGRDSLALSGGFSVQWSRAVSTYIYYDGELARQNSTSHTLNVGMGWSF
jgi:uncharacterized protein YhjY with autotransporter beta-barrel domain